MKIRTQHIKFADINRNLLLKGKFRALYACIRKEERSQIKSLVFYLKKLEEWMKLKVNKKKENNKNQSRNQ